MKSLSPVRKDNISSQVFDQLLLQIIEGVWLPTTQMPSENELSAILNVSRVSVRSALEKLEALGLIEKRHGEGSFVRKLSAESHMNSLLPMIALDNVDLLDVMEYRKILECGMMALVVENVRSEDLDILSSIIIEMERTQDDAEMFAVEDMKFHSELARMSGNSIINKVQGILKVILKTSMINIVPVVGTEKGIYYHRLILKAVTERDSERARVIMAEHLDVNIHRLKELIEQG